MVRSISQVGQGTPTPHLLIPRPPVPTATLCPSTHHPPVTTATRTQHPIQIYTAMQLFLHSDGAHSTPWLFIPPSDCAYTRTHPAPCAHLLHYLAIPGWCTQSLMPVFPTIRLSLHSMQYPVPMYPTVRLSLHLDGAHSTPCLLIAPSLTHIDAAQHPCPCTCPYTCMNAAHCTLCPSTPLLSCPYTQMMPKAPHAYFSHCPALPTPRWCSQHPTPVYPII